MSLRDFISYVDQATRPQPHEPSDRDRAEWFAAAEVQDKPPRIRNSADLRQALHFKNPVRMRRIRQDFAWMQKELAKMGRNPEDARWLL